MAALSSSQVAGRSASPLIVRPAASPARVFGVLPLTRRCLPSISCSARSQQQSSDFDLQVARAAAWSTAAATLLAAGNAQAATEIAQLAERDSRFGIIATLFVPVLGWVAYNIGGPALNQLKNASTKTRGLAAGVGLGAALLLASEKADAAQEVAQLAAGDNRLAIIATLFLPVVGWVLFNIGGPALNQLNQLSNRNKGGGSAKPKIGKKRAVVGALVGLSASSLLLATPHADAANEVLQVAAGDNRLGIIATLFLPVLGWVAFNIGGPALNQLNAQSSKLKSK